MKGKKFYLLLNFLLILLACGRNSEKASSKVKNQNPEQIKSELLKGNDFIKELERLEYFKLTDSNKINEVKTDLIETLEKHNFFLTKTEDESLIYLDNRFYAIDSEDLFEIGGLEEYLKLVQQSFKKLDLQFEFTNEVSEYDEYQWKHTIEINGREYVAFDGLFNDDIWELAYANFIEMLNSELAIQGSNEKFYAIRSGNDGSMVLLTNQQYFLISTSYPSTNERIMELHNWKQLIGLN